MPKTMHKKASGPRQARGRFVSRSISTSEQLASVSLLADFLFERCIPHLDATGRMTGNAALIKAAVVPLRDEINSRNLPELLRELAEAVDQHGIPLVFWYEINGVKVLEFPGFSGHQTGLRSDREAPSKFPPRNGMEKLLHSAGVHPDQLPQKRGASPAQEEVEVEVECEDEEILQPPPLRARESLNGSAQKPAPDARTDQRAALRAEFERVGAKLDSDDDRTALRTILSKAPHPPTFLAELDASIESMPSHVVVTRSQAGRALRDFVGNGNCSGPEPPKLRVFRRYLELAAVEVPMVARPPNGANAPTPGDPDYDPDPFKAGLNRAAREIEERERTEAKTHA